MAHQVASYPGLVPMQALGEPGYEATHQAVSTGCMSSISYMDSQKVSSNVVGHC